MALLLIGLHYPLASAIIWGIVGIPFALVIREQMQSHLSERAPVVRTLRQLELWMMTLSALLIIFVFVGSPWYAGFVALVYSSSVILTTEMHGKGWIRWG